ncbi:ABC transporter permease [bacterium]|nr:ABC transporter permease [bacterium]
MFQNRIKQIDKKLMGYISNTGEALILLAESLFHIFKLSFKKYRLLLKIRDIGVESIPIVGLISLFVGMVLALQIQDELGKLGAQPLVANIVCVSMLRELGPIFASLMMVGRIGARFTAEIGSMQVTEQIRALRALNINPIPFLVVPRGLALVICLPALVLIADFTGILGGYGIAVFHKNISSSAYLAATLEAFELKDLFTGLFKAGFFAVIIAVVGCYKGLTTVGGTEGVGRYTTNSVVTASTLILISDFFLTKLFILVL